MRTKKSVSLSLSFTSKKYIIEFDYIWIAKFKKPLMIIFLSKSLLIKIRKEIDSLAQSCSSSCFDHLKCLDFRYHYGLIVS
jgi:hypothetical protein